MLMGSLREIGEAYQHAVRTRSDDELFWRGVYCERLVMLCDSIGNSARVGGAYGDEQAGGGGTV